MTIVSDWFQAVRESRGHMQRDLKELSPGFPDYDHLISMVSKFDEGAPEREHSNTHSYVLLIFTFFPFSGVLGR